MAECVRAHAVQPGGPKLKKNNNTVFMQKGRCCYPHAYNLSAKRSRDKEGWLPH